MSAEDGGNTLASESSTGGGLNLAVTLGCKKTCDKVHYCMFCGT